MPSSDPALLLLAAASAVAWATAGAARLPSGRVSAVAYGLLGGGAAFAVALAAYGLLAGAGLEVSWEQVMGGGWGGLGAAARIGFVEEGAKLAGLVLVLRHPRRPGAVMATTIGTGAAFAALETVAALSGAPAWLSLPRALLAPVAHAVLAAPLGFGVALAARRGGRAALVVVPLALALAATLHAAGDLALAAPRYGRLGYAGVLIAPVLVLFLHVRRLQPQAAAVPVRSEPASPRYGFGVAGAAAGSRER